jgi:hypothetical protein
VFNKPFANTHAQHERARPILLQNVTLCRSELPQLAAQNIGIIPWKHIGSRPDPLLQLFGELEHLQTRIAGWDWHDGGGGLGIAPS